MSKAILPPGACTQVLFSCEELWNSLFTIGALCFPLPNLRCLWNAVDWRKAVCIPLGISHHILGDLQEVRGTNGTFIAHTWTQLLALAVWRGSGLGSKQALTCHSSLGSINYSSHFLLPSLLPSPCLKKPHTKKSLLNFYMLWEN